MSTTNQTIPLGTGIKVMTLIVQTNNNTEGTYLLPKAGMSRTFLTRLWTFFGDLNNGVWQSNINVIQGGVYASGTATLASTVATNTLVIGGVTLTATNGTPTTVQFKVGATDTATAVNLAAAINALTTLNKVVQATSALGVVTIVSLIPGTIGNLITLSSTGGTITVGSALTGGTDGSIGNISHGL